MAKSHQNHGIFTFSFQGQYLISIDKKKKPNYPSLRQETELNYFCVLEDVLIITGKATVRTQNIQEKPHRKEAFSASLHRQCDIESTTRLSGDLLQTSIPVTSLSC